MTDNPTPVQARPAGGRWKVLSANDIYGGVIGTVFASATLAAIPVGQAPSYSALWVAVSVAIAAVTRSYGQHVSTHEVNSETGFWRDLGSSMLTGIPMVLASIPTVVALWLAHIFAWRDDVEGPDGLDTIGFTSIILLMNAALLFGWGLLAGRIGGYSRWGALAVGVGNAGIGLVVILVNLMIK
ncbi:hypothetical protein [Mycolicibacterium neoaurum]|uniref:Yip1 domain-containing protein n=1 Tax=Mycolicibacterium neoaurum TaxID=1795 RepID=A0AAV2WPY7_MYCNE|nr:hypothetical protein [Mycolicibacterium neoaurum]TLH58779.1 hypothetical protein C1S81_11730 [Mycolicibacterium neoaurum]CDQ46324.1 hypothetical protein BN1047_04231 [Mycolicibacterium neoaurum]